MGIRAGCSHCDFERRFDPSLAGRFYRCPRCREGVIAVPSDPSSQELLPTTPLPRPAAEDAARAARDEESERHRGEVGYARRILVECGLCGYLVRIPVEFFGKTVRCPECEGDTAFTESTLEPVKDELFARMALATDERQILFPDAGEAAPGRAAWRSIQAFLVGAGIGLLAIGLWWLLRRG